MDTIYGRETQGPKRDLMTLQSTSLSPHPPLQWKAQVETEKGVRTELSFWAAVLKHGI
uniref:Uncharacterized protein n=1 Tax=Zea mays TaxID=4577 RepID=C4J1J4_MAIZE|nr:unknown [Zea mays]